MPKIPINDQIIDVSKDEFGTFLRIWVSSLKNFGISVITTHCAGLADFSGNYVQSNYELFQLHSSIIEPQIETDSCLMVFHELLRMTEMAWFYEQEIVQEYANILNLDISTENNRKKLKKKVFKYRFGDISKGVNMNVPESVLRIREKSLKLISEIERIATDLDSEIVKMMNIVLPSDIPLE